MKNILTIALFTISCKAQTINIKDQGNYMHRTQGQYYKDIDNLLNPFEGTWLFTDGNSELKIILTKKVNHDNGVYRKDVIIGGYEYKVNGTTLVNTLDDINNFYLNSIQYSISGNSIMENDYTPPCPECTAGEKRLRLSFSETASNLRGKLYIRKVTVNGQEALKIKLQGKTVYYEAGTTPPPDDFVLPSGEYTLIKQ
jgi:hypothetical protein